MAKLNMELNVNPSEIKGTNVPEPGIYYVQIVDVDDRRIPTDKGFVADKLKLEILSGTVIGQENKFVYQSIFLRPNKSGVLEETDLHLRWAWAAGLVTPGQSIDFQPRMLSGKCVVIQVDKDKSGRYTNITSGGYDVWRPDHSDVKLVPKIDVPQPVASSRNNLDDIFPA